MRTMWFEHELRILSRNTIIDLLVRKANRADKFWDVAENFFRRIVGKPIALGTCAYESLETSWGACDGGLVCGAPATEMKDGYPVCGKHSGRELC